MVNCVEDYFGDGFDALERALTNHSAETKCKASKIAQGVDLLWEAVTNTIDKSIDKFQLYTLKNVLSTPADLILPSDENIQVDEEESNQEEMALESEIRQLREQLESEKYAQKIFVAEGQQLHEDKQIYNELLTSLNSPGISLREAENLVFGTNDAGIVSKVREVVSKARMYAQESARLRQEVSQRADLVVNMGASRHFSDQQPVSISEGSSDLLRGFQI